MAMAGAISERRRVAARGDVAVDFSGASPWRVSDVPENDEDLRVFHVAVDGDDANDGQPDAPWRTLSKALERLRAGDTLYVHGGVYEERVDIRASAGRPDARITVSAYKDERPLVVGLLWLAEPSYWTVKGIDVTWSPANSPDEPMVRFYGGTGWVLSGAELSNARSVAALMIDDGPNENLGAFVVRNNCIHDTLPANGENQDHNIYVDDFGSSPEPRGIIERNLLFNAPNGNNIKLGGGNGGGPRNVEVRFNSMFGGNRNVSVSIEASNISIHHNLLGRADEANIFGFELDGTGNTAFDNVGFDAPVLVGSTPGKEAIVETRNVQRDPGLDDVSCAGFRPEDSALPYGRFAPTTQ